jgi:hypothetical protein
MNHNAHNIPNVPLPAVVAVIDCTVKELAQSISGCVLGTQLYRDFHG